MNNKNIIIGTIAIIVLALGAYIFFNQKPGSNALPLIPSREITSSADKLQGCFSGDYIQGQMGGGGNSTYENFFLNTDKGNDFLNSIGLIYCGSYVQPHPRGGDVTYYVYRITNQDLAKEADAATANDDGSEDIHHVINGGDLDVWFEQKYTGKNLEQYGGW